MENESCYLYDRPICDTSENACTKCQLQHMWNHTISLVINEIKAAVGSSAFTYKVHHRTVEARKPVVEFAIKRLQQIELQIDNLNI